MNTFHIHRHFLAPANMTTVTHNMHASLQDDNPSITDPQTRQNGVTIGSMTMCRLFQQWHTALTQDAVRSACIRLFTAWSAHNTAATTEKNENQQLRMAAGQGKDSRIVVVQEGGCARQTTSGDVQSCMNSCTVYYTQYLYNQYHVRFLYNQYQSTLVIAHQGGNPGNQN